MFISAGLAQNRLALIEFFDRGGQLTEEQKQRRYKELQKEYDRLRILGEMKVALAERMQEVLETYMQYLDKEKTHFKYELEADNPGITEVIETRFANYCESLIALRKERKRRLTNGSVDLSAELLPHYCREVQSTTSSPQLGSSATSTMPTFVGPESRHGRPRKLTSRVQEMFKEAVQRQRHSHYHKSTDTTHIPDFSTEDDDDISEEEGESDDSKRKWCFCNEKSYGDMVACDNKACPYQWFHYPCVNISSTPKGRWYCPHCSGGFVSIKLKILV
uniref:Inhibitor of growth protein n=1 Tax=Angiostrongylus cantonensis TaxID=6313 RepID=A0A0K0DBU3_ANGCA